MLHDLGGTQLHKLTNESGAGAKLTNESGAGSEVSEVRLHQMLGLSISHDCINKYLAKPSSMYSFLCAQNFRRDQYPWHFKVGF